MEASPVLGVAAGDVCERWSGCSSSSVSSTLFKASLNSWASGAPGGVAVTGGTGMGDARGECSKYEGASVMSKSPLLGETAALPAGPAERFADDLSEAGPDPSSLHPTLFLPLRSGVGIS